MAIRKFAIPQKPNSFEEPYRYPEDLTILTSDELGQWMSRLVSYKGYVMYLLSRAEIDLMFREGRLKMMIAEESANREGTGTVTAIKNEVNTLESIKKQQELVDDSKKDVIFYTMLKDVYQAQGETISREISRRQRT